jgi:hypothetical protein
VADAIEIPSEFGGSWAAFCEHRGCPDGVLAYSPAEISRALSVIKRLWPEKFALTANQSAQGTATVVPEIETGLLLAVCETAKYFRGMLERLKSGQRSAYSELVLVAALRRLGYDPQFEGAGGGKPDAECLVEGAPISFEVYAPGRSYASQEKQELVRQLREAVGRGLSKCRVEIEIHESFCKDDICQVVEAVQSTAPGTWSCIGDWARIRRIDCGQDLPPTFDGEGARLIIGGDVARQGDSTGVIVRWEDDDIRAERALQEKRRQVADSVANVIVINVSAVGGVGEWPEQVAKLPGSDYEKIGVIAFFDQGSSGPPEAIRRRWRIVVNSRAHIAVPEALLCGLESLDDVSHLDLPPKPRLLMN